MIETRELTKKYGYTLDDDQPTFSAVPGRVTGYPVTNGEGTSTTTRRDLGRAAAPVGGVLGAVSLVAHDRNFQGDRPTRRALAGHHKAALGVVAARM